MDKHNVRKGKDIMFADDKERTIKPLTIRQLRKFVKVINKMDSDKTDSTSMTDEDIANMVDAAEIIMEKVDPILAADRDALEDAIDLQIFGELMNVAMGASGPEE